MGKVTTFQTRAQRTGTSPTCYVRVTRSDHHGYIEFQFSMGDPAIFLEMTLPPAAFVEFCARHQAQHLSPTEAAAVDAQAKRWRYGNEDEE